MNTYDLKGHTAVITGGAQGIGLATAQRMIESGARVMLWDHDAQVLGKTLGRLGGEQLLGEQVDISDLAAVERAAAAAKAALGRVDILVNNAAIVGPNTTTWTYPPDAFRDVVQVGLTGTFYCCRAIVPHMIEAGYGRIVNVSSIAGKEGNPNAVAYSAAKAGVIALTKSLGKELAGQDIAVNAVTPGFAKTALSLQQSEAHIDYIVSKIPRGRMLEIDEAATMICWLATQENSFTTGAVFDLSGGRATY